MLKEETINFLSEKHEKILKIIDKDTSLCYNSYNEIIKEIINHVKE